MSEFLRGPSLGVPCTGHHREERGLGHQTVSRGPPADQYWWGYVEPKWEVAGNDSDVNPNRAGGDSGSSGAGAAVLGEEGP